MQEPAASCSGGGESAYKEAPRPLPPTTTTTGGPRGPAAAGGRLTSSRFCSSSAAESIMQSWTATARVAGAGQIQPGRPVACFLFLWRPRRVAGVGCRVASGTRSHNL